MSIYVRIRDGMDNATEADIRGFSSDIILQEGILSANHLLVEESDTPGMTVKVNQGIAYVPNSAWSEFSSSIKYWDVLVDADAELNISSNPSGSTRVDKICLKVDTAASPDTDASNVATLVVVEGTPGAGAPATPDYHLALATVSVADGATTITNTEITDVRQRMLLDQDKISLDDLVERTATQTLTNKTLTSPVLNGSLTGTGIKDEDDMSSNSATAVPTQQSVKAYVDAKKVNRAFTWYLDGTSVVADEVGAKYICPKAMTVTAIKHKTVSGTATIRLQKGTTDIDASISVTSSVASETTITSASLSENDVITLDITAASSCVGLTVCMECEQ